MIKIRYSRLVRFRKKNQKLMLTAQIVAIWYIAILSVGYLTSSTNAYLTTTDIESVNIHASYWDESILDFIKKGNDNLKEFICPATEFEISTVIKNIGETAMYKDGTYEVFYVETGEPRENGTKVAEGKIYKLSQGEDMVLVQKVTNEGFYEFKTFQDSSQTIEIWSEKIKVKCKTGKSPEKEEKKEVEQGSTLTEPVKQSGSIESTNPSEKQDPIDESKVENVPALQTENSDMNSSNQNNSESGNNNTSKVTEEVQKENEGKKN